MNAQHDLTDELISSAIERRVSAAGEGDLRDRVLAATASHQQRQGWRVRLDAEWLLPQRGLALRLSVALVLLVTVALVAVLVGFRPFDDANPPRLGALAIVSGGDLYVAGPAGESPSFVWDLPPMGTDGRWGLAWLDSETVLLNTGAPFQEVEGAYVVDVPTGDHRLLVSGRYDLLSPNRRIVAVSTFDENATPQGSTRLIEIATGAIVGTIPGTIEGFAWSRDGRSLVGAIDHTIVKVDIATGDRTVLVTGLCCGLHEHMPTWSPDGTHIAYVDYHGAVSLTDCLFRCGTLWSVPAAGGEPTRITAELRSEIRPSFSPDGRWIAYIEQCPCGNDAYPTMESEIGGGEHVSIGSESDNLTIIAVDGSGTRLLAPDPLSRPAGGQFSWDPDSAGITYVASGATLWHVALDGIATQLEGSSITGFARQSLP